MLPVLGALILQAAYGAVDLLVVGRFGSTSGLSAVSTGSQVLNLVTFVVTQLAMGVTLTASYVRICGGGTFFIVAYNLLSAIFRGLGDSRSPLLFVLVACLVNVAGDLPCHRRRQRGLDSPDGAGDRHEDRHRHGPCAGAHPREGRTDARRASRCRTSPRSSTATAPSAPTLCSAGTCSRSSTSTSRASP